MSLLLSLLLSALEASAPGSTGGVAKVLDAGGRIAEEPVRDIGAVKTVIPDILLLAQQAPYAPPARTTCDGLRTEIAALTKILGPEPAPSPGSGPVGGEAGHVAAAGEKTIVNSLIPFRGLVREASGAAAAERRRIQAENAGFERRGFLHGLATSRHCPPIELP